MAECLVESEGSSSPGSVARSVQKVTPQDVSRLSILGELPGGPRWPQELKANSGRDRRRKEGSKGTERGEERKVCVSGRMQRGLKKRRDWRWKGVKTETERANGKVDYQIKGHFRGIKYLLLVISVLRLDKITLIMHVDTAEIYSSEAYSSEAFSGDAKMTTSKPKIPNPVIVAVSEVPVGVGVRARSQHVSYKG